MLHVVAQCNMIRRVRMGGVLACAVLKKIYESKDSFRYQFPFPSYQKKLHFCSLIFRML